MPPAQPASKLLDDDWMEILNKAVDPEATSKDWNGDNSVTRAGAPLCKVQLIYFILYFSLYIQFFLFFM